MPRWLPWFLAATVAAAALLWFFVLAPETIPVTVVRVERGRVESTVTNTKAGTVRARRRASLSPQMGGRVVEIARREGAQLKQGDPILVLNDDSQRAQLRLAKESLRAAQASLREACIHRDHAKRKLERKRELAAEKIVSEDLMDELRSARDTTEAACNRAGAEVGRAQAQADAMAVELDKTVLRAPFDGVMAELAVEVGEWITPSAPLISAPAVADIIDPSSLYISAPMDEVDSSLIRVGQRAKVTIDSQPGAEFAGVVVRMAPYVRDRVAQNRTVEIEVELQDRELASRLLPGTSADVEVVLETREETLRLPTSALLEGGRVLLARNGRLEERSVEIGLKNWNYVEW